MDPKRLLDRFRRGPEPSAELTSALADLERLALARPELEPAARGLAPVLRAAFSGRPKTLDPEAIGRIGGERDDGVALFRAAFPPIDAKALRTRALAVAGALVGTHPQAPLLVDAIRKRPVDVRVLAQRLLAGEGLESWAQAAGVDGALASSVLRVTLLASLAPLTAAIEGRAGAVTALRGDCPCCGNRPLLSESRGLEQRVVHRCGLCAAAWPGERLRCLACGESNTRKLHVRYFEGEQDRYRLNACESCGYAGKIVATLALLSPPSLLVADLASVHLDLITDN